MSGAELTPEQRLEYRQAWAEFEKLARLGAPRDQVRAAFRRVNELLDRFEEERE